MMVHNRGSKCCCCDNLHLNILVTGDQTVCQFRANAYNIRLTESFCSVLRRGYWKDLGWEVFVSTVFCLLGKMGASSEEQFCLRWNDFQQCIKTTFTDLRDESEFMDVTISCDGGEQLKAHKVILSACSVTFRHLLKKNPAQHPVIVLWVSSCSNYVTKQNYFHCLYKRMCYRGTWQLSSTSCTMVR